MLHTTEKAHEEAQLITPQVPIYTGSPWHISNRQQWKERIASVEVRRRWGGEETVGEMVQSRRLEWLGHVARMPEDPQVYTVWLVVTTSSTRRPTEEMEGYH